MRRRMQVSDRIGRRMKLHDIHVFVSVVQAGSMGKAAGLLNTTQSAISRSIADLERVLGVQLLDRSPQGVQPTRYGNALLKRGTIIFDELKQSIADIEHLSDPGAGELCIGTSTPQADGIVFAVLDRLSQQYPRISIRVVMGGILELCDQLRERRIELGCARMSGAETVEDIDEEVLFDDPLVVVAGAKNPWVRRRKIDLADLVAEPWTWTSPGSLTDRLVIEAFRSRGVPPPRARIYAETTSMKIRLAATGRFLAVVPASMLRFHENRALITKLPVEISATRTQVGIITLKNRMLSPLARLFIECAREVSKALARNAKG
ncbi:MAG: transcriptional regulator [Proteobacteria bacterium]|nr:MAG: transcriptional regulator [Pseudomonadota bacterium]